jgi:DinB superfamily
MGDRSIWIRRPSDDLASELQEYEREFAAINQDAKALLGDLSERQLEWREDVACWSISDCVNHLVVTGNQSLSHIRSAIVTARSKGMLSAGPFRHPVAGKLLILLMDGPPRVRFKAPKAYRPANDLSVSNVLAAFWSFRANWHTRSEKRMEWIWRACKSPIPSATGSR